jgi:hypothetical protein
MDKRKERFQSILENNWQILVIIGLGIALYVPFKTNVLFQWDSVNFALGVQSFDPIHHRPHPPGYILYIAMGKILTWMTHDVNTSFVLLSISAGILAACFLYIFGKHLFSKTDGFFAASLLLTSPLIWFFNEQALTYSLEMAFSVIFSYTCFNTREGKIRWGYLAAILLGLFGGIRQSSLLFFAPIFIFSISTFRKKHIFGMIAVLVLICIGWGIPLLIAGGGFWNLLKSTTLLFGNVGPTIAREFIHSILIGGIVGIILIGLHWLGIIPIIRPKGYSWERLFIIMWTVPGLIIILMGHFMVGYDLYLLPAIFLYTPALFRGLLEKWNSSKGLSLEEKRNLIQGQMGVNIFVIAIIGIVAFLIMYSNLLKTIDMCLLDTQKMVIEYPPGNTIVVTDDSRWLGFRHAEYYFPDYYVYMFVMNEPAGAISNDLPPFISGWFFHSYQMKDDYSLNIEESHLHTTLDLTSGTTGLIVTNPDMSELIYDGISNPIRPLSLKKIGCFTYVGLPINAQTLIVENGTLVVR